MPRNTPKTPAVPGRITMKKARRAYAGRETIASPVFDAQGKLVEPKKRTRRHRVQSFIAWAQGEYAQALATGQLSPKLARIVARGGAA